MPEDPSPNSDEVAAKKADEPAPPPQPPSTALAIGFAIPAILMLLGGLAVKIAWSSGFPFTDVRVLMIFGGALVAWTACFFFALDGFGYALRCALRWPYKVLLVSAHLLAMGSAIWVPAGVGLATRADRAIRMVQIKAQAEPLRRELVAFHLAQHRFPLAHEWAMIHPLEPQGAQHLQGLPTYEYRTLDGRTYELIHSGGRTQTVTFVFDPLDRADGGLGWRIDNDSGDFAPVQPVEPLPGEEEIFAELNSSSAQ